MKISADEVKKVGVLARLEISDDELGPMAEHFNNILEYFDKMKELNLEDTDAFTMDGVEPIRLRADKVVQWGGREDALSQAPNRHEDFIIVPRIGGDGGEE